MLLMMPSAAVLSMVPEGNPHVLVPCDDEVPLVSCPRSIIDSEWSLFLKAGV